MNIHGLKKRLAKIKKLKKQAKENHMYRSVEHFEKARKAIDAKIKNLRRLRVKRKI